MANDIFDVLLAHLLSPTQSGFTAFDFETASTVKACFFDKDDDGGIPDYTNDQDIADMTLGRVPTWATCPYLTTPTVNGTAVYDAVDTVFSSLSGDEVELLIIARYTGTEADDILIAGWDTGVTGFPLQPNGGNVTVQWNGSGILSLGA